MLKLIRTAAAMGSLALTLPVLAAELAPSAMAGDPTWPAVESVAPSMALTQQPAEQAPGGDPTQPAASVSAPAIATRQAPLTDDPLQGYPVVPGGNENKGSEPRVACHGSCACAG